MRPTLLILLFTFLLSACNRVDLYSQVSERQANEMVAVLQSIGIEANKKSKDGTQWSVQVGQSSFARAVDVLRANGYPREEFDTLGRVFKKEGFVSSPLEERARLIYGMSQELSNTLSAIDGVVVARVHLAVPEKDPLADKVRASSASVLIKHRPNVDLRNQIGQIKSVIVNSVEGLPYDNVTVALFPAQTSAPTSLTAPADHYKTSWWDNISTYWLVGALLIAVALGVMFWWSGRPRPRRAVVPSTRRDLSRTV